MKVSDFNNILGLFTSGSSMPVKEMEELIKDESNEIPPFLMKIISSPEIIETSYASLWSIIILGEKREVMAIPFLLDIFFTDYDILCEATIEALVKIGKDSVLDVINFIENTEDSTIRSYGYEVLGYINNKDTFNYLIRKLKEDEDCLYQICHSLVSSHNKEAILHLKKILNEEFDGIHPDIEECIEVLEGKRKRDLTNNWLFLNWKDRWMFLEEREELYDENEEVCPYCGSEINDEDEDDEEFV
jgi:HEAT repeat protein